jgi:hypothetical protein
MQFATTFVLFFFAGLFCTADWKAPLSAHIGTGTKLDQSPEERELIGRFADPTASLEDIQKQAENLSVRTENATTKQILEHYIGTLKAMAKKKKDQEQEKNEIRKLVYSLKAQRNFAFFATDDAKSPAGRLLSLGDKAVPFLIDELDNGDFTRSIAGDGFRRADRPVFMHVQRVGDCAAGILWQITGQSYGDRWNIHDPRALISPKEVKSLYKKWWEERPKKN